MMVFRLSRSQCHLGAYDFNATSPAFHTPTTLQRSSIFVEGSPLTSNKSALSPSAILPRSLRNLNLFAVTLVADRSASIGVKPHLSIYIHSSWTKLGPFEVQVSDALQHAKFRNSPMAVPARLGTESVPSARVSFGALAVR